MRKNVLLGDFLVEQDLISEEQLRSALKHHHENGIRLGRALIDLGTITEKELIRALGDQLGVQYVNLKTYRLDPDVIHLIPGELARNFLAVPLFRIRDRLTVALENPLDIFAIDALTRETKMKIEPVVSAEADIREAIETHYVREIAETSQGESDDVMIVPGGDEKDNLISEIDALLDRLAEGQARRACVIDGKLRVELVDRTETWDLPERVDPQSFVRLLTNLGEEKNARDRISGHFFIEKKRKGRPVRFHLLTNAAGSVPALTIHVQMQRPPDAPLLRRCPSLQEVVDRLQTHGGIAQMATASQKDLDGLFYAILAQLSGKNAYPVSIEAMPASIIPNTAQFICESKSEVIAALKFARDSGVDALFVKSVRASEALPYIEKLAGAGCKVLLANTCREPWHPHVLLRGFESPALLDQVYLAYPRQHLVQQGLVRADNADWLDDETPDAPYVEFRWQTTARAENPADQTGNYFGELIARGLRQPFAAAEAAANAE